MTLLSTLRSYVPQNQSDPLTVRVVGLLYAGYFVAALVGIILMTANPNEQWPVDVSAYVVFVTSALHFGFTAMGYLLYESYEHAPVNPVWLFLFADYFQAGALGATIASHVLAPSSRPTIYTSASVTMVAQLACMYKTITLLSDPSSSRNASKISSYSFPLGDR